METFKGRGGWGLWMGHAWNGETEALTVWIETVGELVTNVWIRGDALRGFKFHIPGIGPRAIDFDS